jgi:hypothetical protein
LDKVIQEIVSLLGFIIEVFEEGLVSFFLLFFLCLKLFGLRVFVSCKLGNQSLLGSFIFGFALSFKVLSFIFLLLSGLIKTLSSLFKHSGSILSHLNLNLK